MLRAHDAAGAPRSMLEPCECMQGKLEALVAQLLTLPAAIATINAGDKDGLTPLHWASTEGKPQITSAASSA